MNQQFLTYRETDEDGRLCYYILQKAHPHYCGIVSVGPLSDTLASAPVGGYNLYVNFKGTIEGNYVPSYKDVLVDIQACMWDMANWFHSNRVITETKKYAKFKINRDAPIS